LEGALEGEAVVEIDEAASSPIAELLEEIRFYVGQQMWEEAGAVLRRCQKIAPELRELTELKNQIAAGMAAGEAASPPVSVEYDMEGEAGADAVVDPNSGWGRVPRPATGNLLSELAAGLEQALPQEYSPAAKHAPEPAETTAVRKAAVQAGASASGEEPRPAADTVAARMPGDVLSELFEEFKEDAERGIVDADDPESHYNLGVAFREMGLFDEAIGELQKVAQSMEKGRRFRDALQVYTLLGQSFLEKGAPEVAVRWYEKALGNTSDLDTLVAVHYELGLAHEAAKDRPGALKHFLEVYGSNIDYRDVAERIKSLKS
jgi:hypothetical protein